MIEQTPAPHTNEDPLGQWGAHEVIPGEQPDTAGTSTQQEWPTLPILDSSPEADTIQHSHLPMWDTAAREEEARRVLNNARESAMIGGPAMTLAFADLVKRNTRAAEQMAVRGKRGDYVLPLGRTDPDAAPFTRRNVADLQQRLAYTDSLDRTGSGRHRKMPRHRAP